MRGSSPVAGGRCSPLVPAAYVDTLAFALSFVVVTSLFILFADLMPKRLGDGCAGAPGNGRGGADGRSDPLVAPLLAALQRGGGSPSFRPAQGWQPPATTR